MAYKVSSGTLNLCSINQRGSVFVQQALSDSIEKIIDGPKWIFLTVDKGMTGFPFDVLTLSFSWRTSV